MTKDMNMKDIKPGANIEWEDFHSTNKMKYSGVIDKIKTYDNGETIYFTEDGERVIPSQLIAFRNSTAYKETEGKLDYELDREFIQGIAKRMQMNKLKYKPYNRQKEMDCLGMSGLNSALTRHFIAIQNGEFDDDGMQHGHFYAMVCNIMMILYQLKHHTKG